MKTIDLTVNVTEKRLITVQLPDDVSTGEHQVVMLIDPVGSDTWGHPRFSLEGLWANGPDVSPEDIAAARREMWQKYSE